MDDNIRIIQYLGSKMRISDFIFREVERITPEGGTVADVFSGSGVVAYNLAKSYRVYANDIQYYCKIINEALLVEYPTNSVPSIDELRRSSSYVKNKEKLERLFKTALKREKRLLKERDVDFLVNITEHGVFYDKTNMEGEYEEFNKDYFGKAYDLFDAERIEKARLKNEYMLFCLYYANSYFSLGQCVEIDSLKCAIDSLDNYCARTILTACLMHAVSEIVCSVGKNFAQPMKLVDGKGKIKKFAISRCFRDRTMDLAVPFANMYQIILTKKKLASNDNKVFSSEVISFIESLKKGEVDTFYLDPPYTIDHYSRFYHVLETLVLYDYPELEKKKMKGRTIVLNGRYRTGRFQSSFCIPSKGLNEFSRMISLIRSKNGNVVLSYSDSEDVLDTRKRVVSLSQLQEVLDNHYSDVEMIRIDHRYRKLSDKDTLREEMVDGEILFVCRC